MLNEDRLRQILPISGLGKQLSYHAEVGSTNDVAHDMASKGASHGSVVVAEAQTHGRGQNGRHWTTVPGSGLALSIILRPTHNISDLWARLHALSALGVAYALEWYKLQPEIKWPNDILLNGKKVAGVLVEVSWSGDQLDYIVLGIGINVAMNSIPRGEPLKFPAISVEQALGRPVDPYELTKQLLTGISMQYSQINHKRLFERWERKLAYRGMEVILTGAKNELSGTLMGLNGDGLLEVDVMENNRIEIGIGDYQIRLKDR